MHIDEQELRNAIFFRTTNTSTISKQDEQNGISGTKENYSGHVSKKTKWAWRFILNIPYLQN